MFDLKKNLDSPEKKEELDRLQATTTELYNEMMAALPNVLQQKDRLREQVHTVEYCFGSELHRGWYCPSIVCDLVVGGCSRGRLVKKPRSDKYSFKYYFNSDNKLVIVDRFCREMLNSSEYLIYEGDIVRGYTFSRIDRDGPDDTLLLEFSKEVYTTGFCSLYQNLLLHPVLEETYESGSIKDGFSRSQYKASRLIYESYHLNGDKLLCEMTDYSSELEVPSKGEKRKKLKASYSSFYTLFDLDTDYVLKEYDYSVDNRFPSGEDKRSINVHRQLNVTK